jgi:hypothetical protein
MEIFYEHDKPCSGLYTIFFVNRKFLHESFKRELFRL